MQRQEVTSSTIKSIGYDAAKKVLEIEFLSGGIYQYHGFSGDDWLWFRQQKSIGKHFAAEIRNKFTCIKLEPETHEDGKSAAAGENQAS